MLDVHYFAAARAAAGVRQERVADPPATLGELLDDLAAAHSGTTDAGMGLGDIFARCSFLLDGTNAAAIAAGDPRRARLNGVGRLDILPPFAGG